MSGQRLEGGDSDGGLSPPCCLRTGGAAEPPGETVRQNERSDRESEQGGELGLQLSAGEGLVPKGSRGRLLHHCRTKRGQSGWDTNLLAASETGSWGTPGGALGLSRAVTSGRRLHTCQGEPRGEPWTQSPPSTCQEPELPSQAWWGGRTFPPSCPLVTSSQGDRKIQSWQAGGSFPAHWPLRWPRLCLSHLQAPSASWPWSSSRASPGS